MRIRIAVSRSVPAGDPDLHHGTLPRRTADHDLAAERTGPLAHAQEPERLDVGEGRRRDAGAVVPDLEDHVGSGVGQGDPRGLRPRVARDVGQGFLTDAEQRDLEVGPYLEALAGRPQRALDARAFLEFLGMPL